MCLQANSYVLTKLLHAIAPFLLVITAFSLWDVCVYCVAQAGLQPLLGALLPGLRMGQALAGLLTFAGATALIIEVCLYSVSHTLTLLLSCCNCQSS